MPSFVSRKTMESLVNNEKFLTSTQFESTYARSAFPCWDEPEYKAICNVSLEVGDQYTALSNMNIVEENKSSDGKKVAKFATTPLMSTYLAWVFFFSMDAMENRGLVTYREVCLLVDELKSSTRGKQRVALTVAHELGHLWFGNLVTTKWWTDLWLKEGFASFMEYVAVDKLCPEFNIWRSFLDHEVASGYFLDSMRNSQSIEVEMNNPNDKIYDCITYAKSNCMNPCFALLE